MTQLYQSKIFANGSTTLPKPVRDALGVKAGDSVRYVISERWCAGQALAFDFPNQLRYNICYTIL